MFRKKSHPKIPTQRTEYPTGICVETEAGRFYLHADGKRYKINSEEVFQSWRFPLVVKSSEIAVKHIPIAVTKLGFRDGTLIHNIKDARLYLVSAGKRRPVVTPNALYRLGLNKDSAMVVSDVDINSMKLGDDYA